MVNAFPASPPAPMRRSRRARILPRCPICRFTSVAVAIKVSRLPHPLEQLCRCVPLLTMIPREPTVMQRFRDVPGIPPILCISVARRHIAFAMPLYETSVAQWVASHGPLSEPHAAAVLRGLLEIVAKLHEKHVVHRDIKPDNVMLDLAQVTVAP